VVRSASVPVIDDFNDLVLAFYDAERLVVAENEPTAATGTAAEKASFKVLTHYIRCRTLYSRPDLLRRFKQRRRPQKPSAKRLKRHISRVEIFR
jgi:hypothetical protein